MLVISELFTKEENKGGDTSNPWTGIDYEIRSWGEMLSKGVGVSFPANTWWIKQAQYAPQEQIKPFKQMNQNETCSSITQNKKRKSNTTWILLQSNQWDGRIERNGMCNEEKLKYKANFEGYWYVNGKEIGLAQEIIWQKKRISKGILEPKKKQRHGVSFTVFRTNVSFNLRLKKQSFSMPFNW